MSRTKVYRRDAQQRNVRAVIASYMELRKADKETIAVKSQMVKRTLQNKIKYPETFKLGELWDLCDALDIPDEERIRILASGYEHT